MNNLIAITIGDIEGIGIQLLIKLWKEQKIKNFVLFTNKKIFDKFLEKSKIKLKKKIINDIKISKNIKFNSFLIYDYKAKNHYENTVYSITKSYQYCKKNNLKGIITLPLNKEKIINHNKNFIGHTEFYQKIDKKSTSNMVFVHKKLIIIPLTTHIKLSNVIKKISHKNYLFDKVESLNKSLIQDFKIINPKIIISGVNPHGGENGKLGQDEIKYLNPLLKKLKRKKINITGPISGDAMINDLNLKKYDAFLFIYHDQALIPFKILSKFNGINFTSGLSFLRVSPAHGTAYDLVGKNIANSGSLLNCFKFIKKLNKSKKN